MLNNFGIIVFIYYRMLGKNYRHINVTALN